MNKNEVLKKILQAIITPSKWGKLSKHIGTLFNNIVRYRSFSLNPNTKHYWNSRLSKIEDFWRDENYFHILDLFPQNGVFSLLDIGCAIGDGCEMLQKKFPKASITGVDISEVGIEKAKQKTRTVKYLVLDILKDELPEQYDYITIIETLEHFDNPFFVIDKCLNYVKEAIILSTPYSRQTFSTAKMDSSEHRYFFNEDTFSNYNCRVIKITDFVKVTKSRCIVYEIRPSQKSLEVNGRH